MPNDDGGVSAALAGAKATLKSAQDFSRSASGHSSDPQFTAHKVGVSFAQSHGADHQGGTIGAGIESAAAGLKARQANVDAYAAANKE